MTTPTPQQRKAQARVERCEKVVAIRDRQFQRAQALSRQAGAVSQESVEEYEIRLLDAELDLELANIDLEETSQ